MREIFGSKCNYKEIFKETFERRFIDIENETNAESYIQQGICKYEKENSINIVDILSNREELKIYIMNIIAIYRNKGLF